MMKNYLLELLHRCSDDQFDQDAIEWAVVTGLVKLTYDMEKDVHLILGEPGKPDTGQLPAIQEAYRRVKQDSYDALIESYRPLLEELNRARPLAA